MRERLEKFIKEFENKVAPLSEETAKTYFKATITGNQEEFAKASELQYKLNMVFADEDAFKEIREIRESGEIEDPLLVRQLEILYNDYASNQFDKDLLKEIINISTKTEEKFSTFRVEVDGKKLTDNEVDKILETSTDSEELRKVWEGSKTIGEEVEDNVRELVKLRNKAARELGYKDHHSMSLLLSEQDPDEIENLFDELDNLTRFEFRRVKDDMDTYLAGKFGIPKEELMPWHYEDKFFQQGPEIYSVDFDKYFKDKDIVQITTDYYKSIGLEISDLVEKSDLFEKEGKYQHAYCMDIDRKGDVRVVCNVKPNHKWMATMLHEFGHAVYDKYISDTLPFTLHTHAHIFTTEAIAMLFGRFPSTPDWLNKVIGVPEEETNKISADCYNALKLEQLVFSRWVQVMYRFEREMYSNPDADLNELWWNLVEKYQMIKKPDGRNKPDWAAKIHVALYPAYYHNYMLGELLASQLYSYISDNITDNKSFYGSGKTGDYLVRNVFEPGASYHWSELVKRATGVPLSPEFYARQFVGS